MVWLEDSTAQVQAPRRRPDLGTLGWAHELLEHQIARTRITLRKRIEIYRQVSVEYNDAGMLTASNLDALKNQVLRTLEAAKQGFLDNLGRLFAAAGDVSDLAAKATRDHAADVFDASCLGVIYTGISTLEAEAVANRHRRPATQIGCNEQPASSIEQAHKQRNDSAVAPPIDSHQERATSVEEAIFRKEDGMWRLSFNEKAVYFTEKLKGLGYIAELLQKPRMAIEAVLLAGASLGSTKLIAVPGLELADDNAIKAVRAELVKKRAEIAGLTARDWTRKGVLQEEILKLEEYLGQVEAHQGRARKVAGTAQRSRSSVTNAVNRAIERISAHHPDLGGHLKKSIKKGTIFIYDPVELPDWQF